VLFSGWLMSVTIISALSHLDVELEGSEGLLQHAAPLLLCQLHAVHAAPVQLLEEVRAADARKREEGQALSALQPERLLRDAAQHLPARQVAQIACVSVSQQILGVISAHLRHKRFRVTTDRINTC